MTEKEIIEELWTKYPTTFRNDNGMAYVGGKYLKSKKILIGGHPIRYGLCPGSGDLVGWKETIITPDMIDKKIAIFTSIEVKTKNDRLSAVQRTWNRNVLQSGGIAIVWKEVEGKLVKLDNIT